MWLYPYLTILTIVLFVAVIASMGIIADTRIQLALSLLSAGLVFLTCFVFRRGRSGEEAARDLGAGSSRRARLLCSKITETDLLGGVWGYWTKP